MDRPASASGAPRSSVRPCRPGARRGALHARRRDSSPKCPESSWPRRSHYRQTVKRTYHRLECRPRGRGPPRRRPTVSRHRDRSRRRLARMPSAQQDRPRRRYRGAACRDRHPSGQADTGIPASAYSRTGRRLQQLCAPIPRRPVASPSAFLSQVALTARCGATGTRRKARRAPSPVIPACGHRSRTQYLCNIRPQRLQ